MPECPSCKRELAEEYRFCPFCGADTAAPRATATREERKVVTVLFVDLVGFTARAEQLDPEDVRAVLAPYHAHMRRELERFGGTVEKFIGDAVMALFGAPVAHEDDAERAVRAALAIRDWAREQDDLQVRIAVNTGEALVSLDARASEGDSMAAGDVVNAAARLQTAAPLNGVLVGEQTYRATAQVFEYAAVESVTAKGKSEPVPAWEASAALSRFGVDVTRSVSTPLVGRTRELHLLVSTLDRVREESSPQLVTLVGVPGIGKSRLVHELFRAADEQPGLTTWRQGRSLPYGDGVTFWALAEIVKAEAGILETDSPPVVDNKLARAVARLGRDGQEVQWLERQLQPLVGLNEGSPTGVDEASAAWRRFVELVAERGPTVCVFEDLHWADDALLDFVDALVERSGAVPLLVLATARPELLQRRPGWGGGKPNALAISLTSLSDDDASLLVGHLVERTLGADERAGLIARAGGNPLYAEQFARLVNERDTSDGLPESVQGIIAARLDALPDQEKRLLQDAAVVGKVFWLGAVEAVDGVTRWQAEELLHALERKEFVQRSRSSSVGSEAEYAFRHVLIRDVAYGQIPRGARADKHERVATWIESLGRSDDQAELVAHHYLQALELAEATGRSTAALADAARFAFRDAGERAAALSVADGARKFFDAALKLWPHDDPERPYLLMRLAAPLGGVEVTRDHELLEEAAAALTRAGDDVGAAEAERLLARSYWLQGLAEQAAEHSRRSEELIRDTAPSGTTADVLCSVASLAMLSGSSSDALRYAERALALAEQLELPSAQASAGLVRGSARVYLGDDGGLADIEGSVELARSIGALELVSRHVNGLSVAHIVLGDVRAAGAARHESGRIAKQIGSEVGYRWYQGTLCDQHYRDGDWDTSLALCDTFLAWVETGERHYMAPQAMSVRAQIRIARGDDAGAARDVERALDLVREIADPQLRHYTTSLATHVLSFVDRERASTLATEFLALLRGGGELQFAVIALPAFAAAAHRLGLGEALGGAVVERGPRPWFEVLRAYAAGDLVRAADALREIGSLPDEAEARLLAAEALIAAGRADAAEEQLERALAFFRGVRATRFVAAGEALAAAAG
jgi:class 3 adenylate cyclase/tetratricopeptide (TPR) repeat protein